MMIGKEGRILGVCRFLSLTTVLDSYTKLGIFEQEVTLEANEWIWTSFEELI